MLLNVTLQLNLTYDDEAEELRWSTLLLVVFVFSGILGNLLVILAVATEKKLQNVTNFFLLSLAVADLLVSVLVMPLSIINEMFGYWPLGHGLCNAWILMDVLLCTSSIIHMSVISFDRYVCIRSPLKTRNKSMKIVGLKILFVWIVSFLISSPLLGLGIADEKNVLDNGLCAIQNGYFMLYGSVSAFFIPLVLMTITYSLTVDLLKKQADQCRSNGGGGALMRRSTSSRKRRKEQNGEVNKVLETGEHEQQPLIDRDGGKGKVDGPPGAEVPRLKGLVMKHSMKIKAATLMLQRRDAMERRERENTVKTEQKAAKVLGIMFGLFVLCWGPFFTVNILIPLCSVCVFNGNVLTAFLWLGYISSILNPVVYTAFNRTFRLSFIRLLLCRYRRACLDRCPCFSRKTQPYGSESNVSNKPRVSHDSRSDVRRDSESSQSKKLVTSPRTNTTSDMTSEKVVSSPCSPVTSSCPSMSLCEMPKRECDMSSQFGDVNRAVSSNGATLVPNPLTRSRSSLRETSC